jgi:hypothetical protein
VEGRSDQLLHGVCGGTGSSCLAIALGDSASAFVAADRRLDRGSQPLGRHALGRKPGARACHLDAAGNFELVAPERHDAHRNTARKRLLGDAHAAVGDRASGAIQHRAVRDEGEHPRIGGSVEAHGITGGERGHDVELLAGQRLERAAHEPAVVLELRRGSDEHDRRFDLVEPARGLVRRVPVARAD